MHLMINSIGWLNDQYLYYYDQLDDDYDYYYTGIVL